MAPGSVPAAKQGVVISVAAELGGSCRIRNVDSNTDLDMQDVLAVESQQPVSVTTKAVPSGVCSTHRGVDSQPVWNLRQQGMRASVLRCSVMDDASADHGWFGAWRRSQQGLHAGPQVAFRLPRKEPSLIRPDDLQNADKLVLREQRLRQPYEATRPALGNFNQGSGFAVEALSQVPDRNRLRRVRRQKSSSIRCACVNEAGTTSSGCAWMLSPIVCA